MATEVAAERADIGTQHREPLSRRHVQREVAPDVRERTSALD